MNSEVLTAKKWYGWLWGSPFLTVLSVIFISLSDPGYQLICDGNWRSCDHDLAQQVSFLIGVSGAALWHLVLLIPAFAGQSEFVRWHGWQALLLAGIRTAVPVLFLTFVIITREDTDILLWTVPILIVIWLFGTLWGQWQAARGDCALMRWAGHGAGLPLPIEMAKPAATRGPGSLNRETQEHRASYLEGVNLRQRDKLAEAAQVFQRLLVSDATPELKSRVAEELKRMDKMDDNLSVDALVAIFRFSHDPEQQRLALAGLERLGLVETL